MKSSSLTKAIMVARCCEDGDCLIWQRGVDESGAPVMAVDRQSARARRVMYEICIGPVPAGKNVIATCWNKLCIEPSHLKAVTKTEQMQQASEHGRLFSTSRTIKNMRTKRATSAKLTAEQVQEMRARRVDGETLAALAAAYGVHLSRVHKIVTGQAWRDFAVNNSIFNLRA